jgi:hypothetical protein
MAAALPFKHIRSAIVRSVKQPIAGKPASSVFHPVLNAFHYQRTKNRRI